MLLCKVTNGFADGGIAGPVVMGDANSLEVLERKSPALTHHARTTAAAASQLHLTARAEPYEYSSTFTLLADSAVFFRQFTVRNISDKEQLFQTAIYATPPLIVGPK